MTTNRVQIFDTTLRDGEQSPGASMNVEEKVAIAHQLEQLNVDVIEAGFAASSEGDFDSVRRVAETVTRPIVLSLSRTKEGDIERAIRAVDKAKRPGLHVFIATSDIHLKHKLMMSRQDVRDAAVWAVTRAKQHVDYVEFSAEDASRSDPAYLIEVFGAVIDAGARTINVPDTTGYALPEEYGALFRRLRELTVPEQVQRVVDRAAYPKRTVGGHADPVRHPARQLHHCTSNSRERHYLNST